jgi:hypothetical protein
MKYLCLLLLTFSVTYHSTAQRENILDFIPEKDKILFGDATWQLVYGNDNINIDKMIVSDGQLIISEILESEDYRISYFNKDNLLINQDVIKKEKKRLYLIEFPAFIKDSKGTYFGPVNQKQYQLKTDKYKVGKKINLKTKRKNKYYKKIWTFNSKPFESYSSIDTKKNELTFWIKSTDDNSLNYSATKSSSQLLTNNYSDYLQLKPTTNQNILIILDNVENKLIGVTMAGKILFSEELKVTVPGVAINYKLEFDEVTKKLYLFPLYNSDHFFHLILEDEIIVYEKISKPKDLSSHHAIIYNDDLYNVFTVPKLNLKAIYKHSFLEKTEE